MNTTRLKDAILKNGISGAELAKRASVAPSTISRQISHGVKTVRIAKRYAKLLNCSPIDILEI